MATMTIGQLASQAGVGVETVRFYERMGLIEDPPRRHSGYRAYPSQALSRLRFIRQAKELGFSLKEIKGLLDMRIESPRACSEVRQRVDEKISDLEGRMRSLASILSALEELAVLCDRRQTSSQCPILDSIADQHPRSRG